jgi:hypothetical protein
VTGIGAYYDYDYYCYYYDRSLRRGEPACELMERAEAAWCLGCAKGDRDRLKILKSLRAFCSDTFQYRC